MGEENRLLCPQLFGLTVANSDANSDAVKRLGCCVHGAMNWRVTAYTVAVVPATKRIEYSNNVCGSRVPRFWLK